MLLFLGIFILDQISKYLTVKYLPLIPTSLYPYGGIGIFQDFLGIQFSLNYAANKGAAWGIFADFGTYLVAGRIVLISILTYYLTRLPKGSHKKWPLLFILAGAFSNVVDAFTYGHVVDMFHFVFWGYDYPIFNIADASICIGITLYLIQNGIFHDSTCKVQ